MKRKRWILIIFIVLLLGYIAYLYIENNSYKATLDKTAKAVSTIDKVMVSIKENTLTKTGAVLIIKNESNTNHLTGEAFYVEKKENGKWYSLKPKHVLFWIAIGYDIKTNEEREFECNWDDMYGKLEKGTYRLVKELDSKRIAAEFEIKD